MSSTLQDAMKTQLDEIVASKPGEYVAAHVKTDAELKESGIKNHCLKTGEKIPSFSLPDGTGKVQNIFGFHDQQWLIISFYRGEWCPFCNIYLKQLQKHLERIENVPARLVAISPQLPDKSLSQAEKLNLKITVLSDVGNKVGKLFGLVYTVPDYLKQVYEKDGLHLEYYNGEGKIELPLPATYIVNRKGEIVYQFVETFPTDRLDPEQLVSVLKKLITMNQN